MKTILRFATFLLIIHSLWNNQNLQANHAMAVDLTYACLNDTIYTVNLAFYFDCSSSIIESAPDSVLITAASASCGQLINRYVTYVADESDEEVSQICQEELQAQNTTCFSGGMLPGVRRYRYRDTIVIRQECPDWVFSYQMAAGGTRSANITNLELPDILQSIYVEATLNNMGGQCNNSPNFTSLPTAYFCNQFSVFTQGSIEVDGDSLVFTLIAPRSSAGTNVPYALPSFTPDKPMLASVFDFNTETGRIDFQPSGQQFAVIAVLIEEYRNGQLIGSTMRDMQFLVLDCTNKTLDVTFPDEFDYALCPNEPLHFEVMASDGNAEDSISIYTNIHEFPVGATFTSQPADKANPIMGVFDWQPTLADAGFYTLEMRISDNRCPISSNRYFNYNIEVLGETDAGPDRFYCNDGDRIIIEATGGNSFDWTPTTDLIFLSTDSSVVEVVPSGMLGSNITYTVTNNCGISDEVTVNVVDNFSWMLADTIAICAGLATQLNAVTPSNDFSFYWWPNTHFLTPNNIMNPAVQPNNSQTYYVAITSNATNCTIVDSVFVDVSPFEGEINISTIEDTLCVVGENTQLEASVTLDAGLSCGLNTEGCINMSVIYELTGNGLTSFTETPYNGFWNDARQQLFYTRADLQNLGMQSSVISAIAFNVTSKSSSASYNNFSIKMTCINVDSSDVFLSGLQEVLVIPSYETVDGWNVHTLDNPYNWDGESNLLIEICFDNNSSSLFDAVAVHETDFNSVLSARTDAMGENGCITNRNFDESNLRPDIRFEVCYPENNNQLAISWSPPTHLSDATIANPIASPTETTTYTVTFDDNGCRGSESITIVVPTSETLLVRADTSICAPQMVDLFIQNPEIIPAAATFNWADGSNNLVATTANTAILAEESTVFTLTVDFNDKCNTQLTASTTITVGDLDAVSISEDARICAGETISLRASGGTVYQWSSPETLDDATRAVVNVSPSNTTTYQVTISDGTACEVVETVTVTVLPSPTISLPTNISVRRGESVEVEAMGDFSSISWNPTTGINDLNSAAVSLNPTQSTTYQVEAMNADSCTTTASLLVTVTGCEQILMPTAFSPNGDNSNDVFRPYPASFETLIHFDIYNRWGTKVFDANALNVAGWDGTWNNELQPIGTYFYDISAMCNDKILRANGAFALIR